MRQTRGHVATDSSRALRSRHRQVATRGVLVSALAIAALTGSAACAGNADAGPSPTAADTSAPTEPTTTAMPEDEVEKPERPAAMDRDDAAGAAAAAEYFIELYPYVMATGDTSEFEAMSHEACGFCSASLRDTRRINQNNNEYIGGHTKASIIQEYEQDALTGIHPFDMRVTQDESKVVDANGKELSSLGETVSIIRVEVGRRSGQWFVAEVASADGGRP